MLARVKVNLHNTSCESNKRTVTEWLNNRTPRQKYRDTCRRLAQGCVWGRVGRAPGQLCSRARNCATVQLCTQSGDCAQSCERDPYMRAILLRVNWLPPLDNWSIIGACCPVKGMSLFATKFNPSVFLPRPLIAFDLESLKTENCQVLKLKKMQLGKVLLS